MSVGFCCLPLAVHVHRFSSQVQRTAKRHRGVSRRTAPTNTKTNHRRDIYFLLFRGNRATRPLFFSIWKPSARLHSMTDFYFRYRVSISKTITHLSSPFLARGWIPLPSCHVSINDFHSSFNDPKLTRAIAAPERISYRESVARANRFLNACGSWYTSVHRKVHLIRM